MYSCVINVNALWMTSKLSKNKPVIFFTFINDCKMIMKWPMKWAYQMLLTAERYISQLDYNHSIIIGRPIIKSEKACSCEWSTRTGISWGTSPCQNRAIFWWWVATQPTKKCANNRKIFFPWPMEIFGISFFKDIWVMLRKTQQNGRCRWTNKRKLKNGALYIIY